MKVPYNWLRDYVEVELSPQELAERLTMVGLEVGAVTIFAPLGEKIVAGRIEGLRKHPNASNLQLVNVHLGTGSLEVVCGAKNIKKGDMVPVALTGSVLPDGKVIKQAEIRGVSSSGMLCSAGELGLEIAEEEEGIMLLDIKCSPGEKLTDLLPFNEPVLEVDLTPNRGDCLGMLGIAREVAAITGKKIVLPPDAVEEGGEDIEKLGSVEILAPDLCYRYTARIMEGITIKPSPLKMQLRLLSVGIRSISNLVDVTNYVMWE
ncbi:MAG: Phenylalanine--tRNA ligase beta subunit, partial [Microgenomates bacterium 39_6]